MDRRSSPSLNKVSRWQAIQGESVVYGALEGCREKTGTDPVQTLKRALDNVRPTLEVRSRRVGGTWVPVEVKPLRTTSRCAG